MDQDRSPLLVGGVLAALAIGTIAALALPAVKVSAFSVWTGSLSAEGSLFQLFDESEWEHSWEHEAYIAVVLMAAAGVALAAFSALGKTSVGNPDQARVMITIGMFMTFPLPAYLQYQIVEALSEVTDGSVSASLGSGMVIAIMAFVIAAIIPWVDKARSPAETVPRSLVAPAEVPGGNGPAWLPARPAPVPAGASLGSLGLVAPGRALETVDSGPKGVEEWRFVANGSVDSSPVVVDGVVYAASRNGRLYAIDSTTGRLKWAFATVGWISSSPAVVDGTIYIGSYDNYLYAVDATAGERRWNFPTGGRVSSSPTVQNGIVYVGSDDNKLYAIDVASGKERWSFVTGGWVSSSPAASDGVIYVGSNDHHLYALEADSGRRSWTLVTSGAVSSSPKVASGTIYVGSENGRLYAVDAAVGELRWTFATEGRISFSSPTVVDGVAYIGSCDRKLYAVDIATGRQRWAFSTDGPVRSSPVVVDGVVYIGSDDRKLHAIDAATGETCWSFVTGGPVFSTPTVANGLVLVGSNDGNLYAIRPPEEERRTVALSAAPAAAPFAAQSAATVSAEQTREAGFPALGRALIGSPNVAPGLSIGRAMPPDTLDSPLIPTGWTRGDAFPVRHAGGEGETSVSLLGFDSKMAADLAYSTMSGGLRRSGWRSQSAEELPEGHICLTLIRENSAQAACYVIRDDALIVSSSALPVNAPEAALLNAVDLARLMNDAYNAVGRPEGP